MAPAAIFVWRVRLLLLAMAIGLSAFDTDKPSVQHIEAVKSIAPQPSRETPPGAAPLVRVGSGNGLVSGAAPGVGKRKSVSSRASTRSASIVKKQKFSNVRSLKKHAKLTPAPKAGSRAVIRTAAKSNGKATVTTAKSRQGASNRANS